VILAAARECGFELAGLTRAEPHEDYERFAAWVQRGHAGEMRYLTDRRGPLRADPAHLQPGAKTILCVGKLYQSAGPRDHTETPEGHGWVSRYAWGNRDYHDVLREGLEAVVRRVREALGFDLGARVCVDTAPLLERSYARSAGLGWIGKNTCLINEAQGSWFFLGEILFDFTVDAYDEAPPDRCGTCAACIEACPTQAIVPLGEDWTVDSNRCISYWTIEAKQEAPAELAKQFGAHVFGCDICQDVCPWNRRAPTSQEEAFQPVHAMPRLEPWLAGGVAHLRETPLARPKAAGLARNAMVALRNRR
jgi:epoxyqueuosine reductase